MFSALAIGWSLLTAPLAVQPPQDEFDAHGHDTMRIENEDKLLVPADQVEEVWLFLLQRFHDDPAFLAELGPEFTSKWSEELFHDTYFDTPSMQLHAMESGVRHRRRENLTDPDDIKSGRELMQIKLSGISSNERERGEIKYDIERMPRSSTPEDRHPMLGRVKKKDRGAFEKQLTSMGLNPESMRPILTVRDARRRVYLLKDGKSFMSISHDRASAGIWWANTEFCELEPELNEIGFTEADAATRAYMESVLERVVQEIRANFPGIEQDLTPKYNKAFDGLESEISFLRSLVAWGLQDDGPLLLVFGGVGVMLTGILVPRLLRKGSRKRGSHAASA